MISRTRSVSVGFVTDDHLATLAGWRRGQRLSLAQSEQPAIFSGTSPAFTWDLTFTFVLWATGSSDPEGFGPADT